jgi:hypothetical protein
VLGLGVADDELDRRAPAQSRLMASIGLRFWPEM